MAEPCFAWTRSPLEDDEDNINRHVIRRLASRP
jgi:hypothetical protein